MEHFFCFKDYQIYQYLAGLWEEPHEITLSTSTWWSHMTGRCPLLQLCNMTTTFNTKGNHTTRHLVEVKEPPGLSVLQAADPIPSTAQISCQLLTTKEGWEEIFITCQASLKPQKQHLMSNTTEAEITSRVCSIWTRCTTTVWNESTEVTGKGIKEQTVLLSTDLDTALETNMLHIHCHKNTILFKYCRKSYLR